MHWETKKSPLIGCAYITDWVLMKSGHSCPWMRWHIATDAKLSFKFSDLLMQYQCVLCILNYVQGNCQRTLGPLAKVFNW